MRVTAQRLVGWFVFLSSVVGTAAGQSDVRVAQAVRNGDKEAARSLLKQGGDPNAPLPDGATALAWAVHLDDLQLVELLIDAGADVNAADEYGVPPIALACTNGNAAMIAKLLNSGADPNIALPTGESPLMTAARTGRVEAVKVLLDRGVDVNAKERSYGQTALMWAAAEGHADVVQVLIRHRADVHARSTAGFTALLFAARGGYIDTARSLIGAGADVNQASSQGWTALVVATVRRQIAFAKFLLEHGADPNLGPGFTPLHWAAGKWERGQTGDDNVTPPEAEDTEWGALSGLRAEEKPDFVKLLLAHGADPNARADRSPRSEGQGLPTPFQLSLVGATPFLFAARAADIIVMRLLLAAGADPMLATTENTTPLMVAAGLGHTTGTISPPESTALEAIKMCLKLGNDVNAVNANGETALHGATYRGLEGADKIIQFLADNGAKVNVVNKSGWSPLTIAEGIVFLGGAGFSRSPSAAELLRKLGAEPSPPDVERNAGAVLARQAGQR